MLVPTSKMFRSNPFSVLSDNQTMHQFQRPPKYFKPMVENFPTLVVSEGIAIDKLDFNTDAVKTVTEIAPPPPPLPLQSRFVPIQLCHNKKPEPQEPPSDELREGMKQLINKFIQYREEYDDMYERGSYYEKYGKYHTETTYFEEDDDEVPVTVTEE